RAAHRHNEFRRERHQFCRLATIAPSIASAPAVVDLQVAPDDPPPFPESLQECRVAGLGLGIVSAQPDEHTDAPHLLAALRARRERPGGGGGAEQRDECAALHSITSSARASSAGGISSPSARAVTRLMTNSNLVGCTTGRSAGLAPLRTLPA